MSICQPITAFSVNFEVAGGVVCRPPGWCPILCFFVRIIFKFLLILFDLHCHLDEQSSGIPQLRVCLSTAGNSLSVTQMELLYDDGCLAAQIPDSRGTFSIDIYSRISPGLLQHLGCGRVLSGNCIAFSQNGFLDKMNFMSCALGISCIIIPWDMNVRRDVFL